MRYIILIALIFLCFTPLKNNKTFFKISMTFYAIFLALRCGQGLDYFSYSYGYNEAQFSFSQLFFEGLEVTAVNYELGYNILVSIFKQFSLSYEIFIATISVGMVFLLYHFIVRYSKNYILSLFVLYASYGMVILESALRQGIAMILLITIALPLLSEKKHIKAYIVMIVAYLFHASSIAFIIFLILFYAEPVYKFIIKNKLKLVLVIALPIIIIVNVVGINTLINTLPFPEFLVSRIEIYLSDTTGYSVTAMGYRLIMLIVTVLALNLCDMDDKTKKLLYLLATGYIIYFAVAQMQLLSRLTMYFEFLEIVVIPALVGGEWRYKFASSASKKRLMGIGMASYMAIVSLLFYSEMNFTLQFGGYKTSYFSHIPYITVFQKDELRTYFSRYDNRFFDLYWEYYEEQIELEKIENRE